MAKGEAQGIEKGIEKGMEKQALMDARSFKKHGVDEETIMQAMGLTAEQVRAL